MFISVKAAVGQLDTNVFPLLLIGSGHTRTKHPDWSTEALSSSPKTKSSSPFTRAANLGPLQFSVDLRCVGE